MIFFRFANNDFSAVLRPAEIGVEGISFKNSIFEYRKVCDSSRSRSRKRGEKKKTCTFYRETENYSTSSKGNTLERIDLFSDNILEKSIA